MSFSIRNSTSSFSSFWFMNVVSSPSSKLDQVLGGGSKDLIAGFSDQDHVFNSNSAFVGYVNAGLNWAYHSRHKPLLLPSGPTRPLVHFQRNSYASAPP